MLPNVQQWRLTVVMPSEHLLILGKTLLRLILAVIGCRTDKGEVASSTLPRPTNQFSELATRVGLPHEVVIAGLGAPGSGPSRARAKPHKASE